MDKDIGRMIYRFDCDGYYTKHAHYTVVGSYICGWVQYVIALMEWLADYIVSGGK